LKKKQEGRVDTKTVLGEKNWSETRGLETKKGLPKPAPATKIERRVERKLERGRGRTHLRNQGERVTAKNVCKHQVPKSRNKNTPLTENRRHNEASRGRGRDNPPKKE